MLVWVGVIRYLGFFKKYNVRTSVTLLSVCVSTSLLKAEMQRNENFILFPDFNHNPESCIPKCDPILLLCGHDLPWILLLWLDCAWALP